MKEVCLAINKYLNFVAKSESYCVREKERDRIGKQCSYVICIKRLHT